MRYISSTFAEFNFTVIFMLYFLFFPTNDSSHGPFYPQYLHFSNKIDDVPGKGNRNIKRGLWSRKPLSNGLVLPRQIHTNPLFCNTALHLMITE
jgi:hypothetical protein